jgi:cytochrome c556
LRLSKNLNPEIARMKPLFLVTAAAATLLAALPAAAQFQKPEDAVKYRKAAFTLMSTHFGRIGAMVQGRVPFDGAAAAANADIVKEISVLPYAGFVEGTSGSEKGQPKANVWTERAKFDAAAKKMQDEVAKLAIAAKANNLDTLKTAFGAAASTCKSCHDDFRNP